MLNSSMRNLNAKMCCCFLTIILCMLGSFTLRALKVSRGLVLALIVNLRVAFLKL